ncbi:MAG: HIT domain-containing protein [Acidobacteriota bacterium]
MYENIYAPWRFKYVTSSSDSDECILCAARGAGKDEEKYILFRGRYGFIILNLFPYNNGHLMIVPNDHVIYLSDLSPETLQEMLEMASKCEDILRKVYAPKGFNIGMNIGKCAGAGIKDHLHLHVIPRWEGDTSFISILSGTRIIPEDIDTTYQKLRPFFS